MAEIITLQGAVSNATGSSGEQLGVTLAPSRGLRIAPAQSAFQNAVEIGNVFGVCSQAGVTSQAGLSLTTPVLTLYNPASSGKNLVLWYAGVTFTVAPATAGAVWVAVNTNTAAAATTGTLTTAHRNMKLGTGVNMVAQPLLAATLPAAPVAISILGVNFTGAITTVPMAQTLERWFNGSIILKPNTALSIQTGVASGASGTFCEYIWQEVAE